MKKFFQKIKPYSVFLILFIVILFFLPENLAKSSESERNAIITSVGVDKIDENYSVTFVSFTPTPSKEFTEVYEVVNEEAETLSEALKKLELSLGKVVEFYHTESIVLGSDAQDDVIKILDYFVKEKTLAYSSIVVGTEGLAKDFLNKVHEKNGNPSSLLINMMLYDSKYVYFSKPTIEDFFDGYYGDMKSSYIGTLELNKEESEKKEEGSGDQGEKTSSKIVKNTGEINLFKNGSKVYKMSFDEVNGLSWFQDKIKDGYVKIEQEGKTKVFHVDNKCVNTKVEVNDNQLKYILKLTLSIDKKELEENEQKHIQIDKISKEESELIKESIRKEINNSVNKLIENKTDIIGIYDKFYRDERIKFKKYLNSLENRDDFLENIIFDIQIDLLGD